jgi:hypothetical protein
MICHCLLSEVYSKSKQLEATMTLSERFERGTPERRLLRSFEIGFVDGYLANVALVDISARRDMVLYCVRDEECDWTVWFLPDDPDAWEDEVYSFMTYEEAREFFGNEQAREIQPNWEAQAEYDELHGTINGEDAGIVAMRELWGE